MLMVNRRAGGERRFALSAEAQNPLESLREDLQYAIELEHATIPPYLTALYSILEGTNNAIRGILRSVATQEMLHMAMAGNILAAIGGSPDLTKPEFLPIYPSKLPFNIGNVDVSLAPFSIELVSNVFIKIEEPEDPIDFTVGPEAVMAALAQKEFQTIGEFYADVRARLEMISKTQEIFHARAHQVEDLAGAFPVRSLADALRAIDMIVQQGEGTAASPLQGGGSELAHFYRFEEIVKGASLVSDPLAVLGYSYSGRPIAFDPQGVIPIVTNCRVADLPNGSRVRHLAEEFNLLYAATLLRLESAYQGDDCRPLLGLMFDMKMTAQKLTSVPIPDADPPRYAAPTFERPS
jgi:rubrerythrin